MRIFQRLIRFMSVAFVSLHGSTAFVDSIQEDVASGTSFAASRLHLGQDEGVEPLRLQIHLGEKDDLIYPNLLWHYRMGVRHFEIASYGLTASQSKKITMFFDRVKDICTLNLIEALVPSSCSLSSMSEASTTSPALNWVLQLTDRQFLCLYQPLSEILVGASNSTLVVPSCIYNGFDPGAPVCFWPQTDEQLIYRTEINYRKPVSLYNNIRPSVAMLSNAAYIADFATMEAAVPFTSDMVLDQLPFNHVIQNSVRHACLRGQDYWGDGSPVSPIIQNSLEERLCAFVKEFGPNLTIRFGKHYIYVPVPKSGCSTVFTAQGSYELNRKIDFAAYKDFSKFPAEIEERYQYLLSDKFYKFTCVRDPYKRILSAFLDKIVYTENDEFRFLFGISKSISFVDFLKILKNTPIKETNEHFKPQWCLAMYDIIHYDTIVHLEKFDQEFQEVMNHLNIPGKPRDYRNEAHTTNSSSELFRYTQECAELVLELFRLDFEYFGCNKTPSFSLTTTS